VRDHPEADAQELEHGSHPLRVAPGEVVVGSDDVDAAAGQRVEHGGEGRQEGLAFAGPHLGDPALVEDDATDQLDVVEAHPKRPLHRLAAHREDFGQRVVQGLLEPVVLALAALLLQLAAALEVGVVVFVLGRLVRGRDLVDLGADVVELGTDLLIGHRLEFGLETVDLIDEWLDPFEFAVVGVDEAGEQAHGRPV